MRGRAVAAADVVRLPRDDPNFYLHLGPFFGSRAAAEEIGGPIWDEPDKRWLVALRDGRAIGICAWLPLPTHTRLLSGYVLPEHRRQGAYAALFRERLRLVGKVKLTATVTAASLGTFRGAGFRIVRQRGRFWLVERDIPSSRKS
jgi:GNAT superfamily N-acetyltransferase